MGEVQYPKRCPQCGWEEAMKLFPGCIEDWGGTYCPVCGYTFSIQPIMDRKKMAEMNNGRLYFKQNKQGGRIRRVTKRKGFGVYAVYSRDGYDRKGVFDKPVTEETLAEFQDLMQDPSVDQSCSYVTVWNESTQTVTVKLGTFTDWSGHTDEDLLRFMDRPIADRLGAASASQDSDPS